MSGGSSSGTINLSISYLVPPPSPPNIFTSPARVSTILNKILGTSSQGSSGGGGGGGSNAGRDGTTSSNNSPLLDLEALCITPNEYVWNLSIKVEILDCALGGNIIDTSVLSLIGALKNFRLPSVLFPPKGEGARKSFPLVVPSIDQTPSPLPLHYTPIATTFALYSKHNVTSSNGEITSILDPTAEEEIVADGGCTISHTNHRELCLVDFVGGCELDPMEIFNLINVGKDVSVILYTQLENALNSAEEDVLKLKVLQLQLAREKSEKELYAASSLLPKSTSNNIGENEFVIDVNGLETSSKNSAETLKKAQEEEAYRRNALDYAGGHFAAKVKEGSRSTNNRDKQVGEMLKSVGRGGLIDDLVRLAGGDAVAMEAAGKSEKNLLADNGGWGGVTEEKIEVKEKKEKKEKKKKKKEVVESESEEETVMMQTSEFAVAPPTVPIAVLDTNKMEESDEEVDLSMGIKKKAKKSKKVKR